MAEKILNTRIQLKYDTLANWQSSVFNGDDASKWLKAGEVAVVTLAPNKEENPEAVAGQHPLLFKVGTGSHKFESLPWASALAADVYDWAKLTYSDFLKEIEKTFYTETEINTLLAGYYTKSEVNGLIEAAEGRAATDAKNKADKALEDAKSYADTEIQKAVTGGTAGLATEKYVNDAVAPKADKTYVDTELAKKLDKTTYEAYINGKSMSDAELKTYAENQASTAKSGAEATAASALSAARTAITTEIGEAVAPLATSKALEEVDAKFADYTKTDDLPTDLGEFTNNAGYAKTTEVTAVLGTAGDAATANTVYGVKAAAAAAQKTADDVTARVAAFLDSEEIDDTVNTLKEIQEELKELGDAVKLEEQFAAKVDKATYNADKEAQAEKDAAQDKALADAIAAEVQRADGKYEEKGVAQGLINALDVNDISGFGKGKTLATLTETDGKIAATFQDIEITSSQISDLDTGVHAVSLASGTNNGTVKLTVDGKDTDNIAVTGLGSAAFVDEKNLKITQDQVTGLTEFVDNTNASFDSQGEINRTLEEDKADKVTNATKGNFAGLDEEGNLTDSGAKAADFATAAQGAKADTAVQPEELAAIAKTGNVNDLIQTEGDILVFNCGSASTVI